MAGIDPKLKELLQKYGEATEEGTTKESIWLHTRKNKGGGITSVWIAKHAACERMATRAGITFEDPRLLFCNNEGTSIAFLITGRDIGGNEAWSIGEASGGNNKNAYPWSIAEKRGKDRVILKLLGMHGMLYSDAEADDFREPEKKTMTQPTREEMIARGQALSDAQNTTSEMRKNLADTAESGVSQR